MKNGTYFLLFVITIFCSCNTNEQKRIIAKDSIGIIVLASDDKKMAEAITTAQSSLSKFDSALFSNNENYNTFSLKVRFPYGEDNGEHIWLREITKKKGVYVGIVNNDPEYVSNVKFDDTIKVNPTTISDWMYLDNDILRGGFTTRLLRNRMSNSERAQFDSSNYFKIED